MSLVHHDWRRWTKGTLGVVQAAGTFAAVVIGASLKADASKWSGKPFHEALDWAQVTAVVTLPLLAFIVGVAKLLSSRITEPWVWPAVKDTLEALRGVVFTGRDGPSHHHRATLFRYQAWCWRLVRHRKWVWGPVIWPWSGWLNPVERTGHTTRNTTTLFRAPDDADKAEGVAGRAWSGNETVQVEGLPDLVACHFSRTEVAEYAERSYVSVEWISQHQPKGRSLCGIPVEMKGRRWGVIVLDSREPKPFGATTLPTYRAFAKILAKLLERV